MIILAALAAVPAAACGGDAETGATGLTLADGWVRAEDGDMTAAFGTLVNEGDTDVTIVAGHSEAAGRVELHEVVMTDGEMVMQPKDGGFVVPAGGEHVLEPGGDHVMLLDLAAPIEPGADVTVVLDTADGDSLEFTAQAREFDGAEEEYDPEGGHGTEPSEGMSAEMSER
jgi:hypothetical protein